MTNPALQFEDSQKLGKVAGVDTSKVWIDVDDPTLLTRVGVGNLIAIKGTIESEYLIGITERVTRSLTEELLEEENETENEIPIGPQPTDMLRAFLVGTYRTIEGDKTNVFKRGADSFPQIDRDCFFVEGINLQRFMGLLGADIPEEERLLLGHFIVDRTASAIADGDKFFQRHASILGSTGSGKSWSVALILEKASKLKYPNIIVLDMHGEYAPLTDKDTGFASGLKIAGPGDLEDPSNNAIFLPYWLLNREEMLSMFLDRSDQNAPNQAARFTQHVRELKEETLLREKKNDIQKTFTVDSPIPYSLDDLVKRLEDDDTRKGVGATGKPVKGDWEGKLTRFLSRLKAKIEDRRYGFLFKPPLSSSDYDWLGKQMQKMIGIDDTNRGIKIVDFSEVPSDVLPVVAGTFARLLYNVQFWMTPEKRTPFSLLCDEAHLYLPVKDDADSIQRQALAAFERIAKEGRKYGVSLIVVSQRPSDVSRTILSQCNNFLVLRLTNNRDQNVVRQLMPDSMVGVTDILPLLDIGEAVLLGDAVLMPSRIKLDAPSIEPDSATRDFWTEWASKEPDKNAITEAIETLRKQTRPE
ncbi:MAG: ATP-binding protein [Nitrospirota bacterium]